MFHMIFASLAAAAGERQTIMMWPPLIIVIIILRWTASATNSGGVYEYGRIAAFDLSVKGSIGD